MKSLGPNHQVKLTTQAPEDLDAWKTNFSLLGFSLFSGVSWCCIG